MSCGDWRFKIGDLVHHRATRIKWGGAALVVALVTVEWNASSGSAYEQLYRVRLDPSNHSGPLLDLMECELERLVPLDEAEAE